MLTIDDVAAVSGLDPQTLRGWVADGLIEPTERLGEGRGRGHRFAVPTAVGLVVAAEVRRSDRGCALAYVGRLVAAFATLTEAELAKALDRDGTHLASVEGGRPVLRGPGYDRPDVRAASDAVKARCRNGGRTPEPAGTK